MMDGERMSGQWLGLVLWVFPKCFDAVCWVAGGHPVREILCHLFPEVLYQGEPSYQGSSRKWQSIRWQWMHSVCVLQCEIYHWLFWTSCIVCGYCWMKSHFA